MGCRTKLIPLPQNSFKVDEGDGQIQITTLFKGGIKLTSRKNEIHPKIEEWIISE
ncbi:hypothetical protein P700755_002416 [Psychroflexus torquis ATCC 700755]|uniref:Uncharacterized protein n=1 Tax=Psychroflexus torquis (strain ATCC 700755 / CIP 106069 / ACAM 623) TaxID=313595 RepID=K4IHB1_PSYTT|nr:hypothetical protein [Psychroflexus torquis]AFU69188.1 hypothetical protein P700755_002416 [Psychroflexus torquis ATCC 700755]